jgi:hypothetical protein
MNKQINGLVAAGLLGAALLLSGPAWSLAEPANADAKPATSLDTMTLEELDLVVINAKRFEERLFDSERKFYQLYNQLNARADLDVTCDVWLADPTYSGAATAPSKRHCLPEFVANDIELESPAVPVTIRTCRGTGAVLATTSFDSWTMPQPFSYGIGGGRAVSISGIGTCSVQLARSNEAQRIPQHSYLLYLSRRAEFHDNLDRVMQSDPQLQEIGGQFMALVQERDDTRRVAAQARKLRVELRLAQRKCPQPTSPRSLTKACTMAGS